MPRVISARRTVIFNDESSEYVLIKAVEADNQGLAIHIETIVDEVASGLNARQRGLKVTDADERANIIGHEIYQAMREVVDDEIPYTGTAHRLASGLLANLDWYEIGVYYLEQHEAKETKPRE